MLCTLHELDIFCFVLTRPVDRVNMMALPVNEIEILPLHVPARILLLDQALRFILGPARCPVRVFSRKFRLVSFPTSVQILLPGISPLLCTHSFFTRNDRICPTGVGYCSVI